MASTALLSLLLIISSSTSLSRAFLDPNGASSLSLDPSSSSFQWPTASSSLFDLDEEIADFDFDDDLDFSGDISDRRSLFWKKTGTRYYISYGALSANRIPCPPRSGRSYYTHNCFKARGPVHPYSRGCSAITRCRR